MVEFWRKWSRLIQKAAVQLIVFRTCKAETEFLENVHFEVNTKGEGGWRTALPAGSDVSKSLKSLTKNERP